MSDSQVAVELRLGRVVYDEDGNELGTVRGVDDAGFYVSSHEQVEVLDEAATARTREAIMWRCWECGEMGQIEDIPPACPSCSAPKEEIYYWQED